MLMNILTYIIWCLKMIENSLEGFIAVRDILLLAPAEEIVTMFNTEEFNVLKPMPSPIDKIQNRFRWRIIIKGIMTENANGILNEYLQKFYNCTYKNTKVTIEINPNNMM